VGSPRRIGPVLYGKEMIARDVEPVDAAERESGGGLQPFQVAVAEADGSDAAQIVGDVKNFSVR
jgi:hypothetical protein